MDRKPRELGLRAVRRLTAGLALALTGVPGPAAAELTCRALWLSRMAFFDRAGLCFGSPLGRAAFGGEGCAGAEVALDPEAAAAVAAILQIEERRGCVVDTGDPARAGPDPAQWRGIEDLPVPARLGGVCLGLRGPERVLRSARGDDAPRTGHVAPGARVVFDYRAVEGWSFVDMRGASTGLGWTDEDWDCDGYAGAVPGATGAVRTPSAR